MTYTSLNQRMPRRVKCVRSYRGWQLHPDRNGYVISDMEGVTLGGDPQTLKACREMIDRWEGVKL